MSGSLLGEVSVSGQVLASLFSEAASARGDVDGILFGQACISERTVLNDSDVAHIEENRVLEVTGFVCSDTSCSFYGVDGEISDTALELLAGADPDATVVGWFSARRCVPLRPSAREAAVCAALPAALAALQGGSRRAVDSAGAPLPPLLLLLSGEQPSDGNPFTFEYRAFESHSRSIPLRIANVGQALARGAQGAAPGGVTRRLPLPEGSSALRSMEAGAAQQVANSIALHEELLGVAVKLAEELEENGSRREARRQRAQQLREQRDAEDTQALQGRLAAAEAAAAQQAAAEAAAAATAAAAAASASASGSVGSAESINAVTAALEKLDRQQRLVASASAAAAAAASTSGNFGGAALGTTPALVDVVLPASSAAGGGLGGWGGEQAPAVGVPAAWAVGGGGGGGEVNVVVAGRASNTGGGGGAGTSEPGGGAGADPFVFE